MRVRSFIKNNFWLLLVIVATIVHLGISLKLAIYWYDNFHLGKYDLGNAAQVVHNTLHGKFFTYTDRFGTQISRLSDHADFILLLFVPVFAIFSSPLVLVVAQSLALSLGGLVVYLLGREIGLSKISAFLIAIAYLLNPEVGSLTIDAFHGITFAIPFLFLAFYFFERYSKAATRKNLLGLLVSAFLVLISKEEVSLLIALFGLYAFLFRRKKVGIALASVGFLWFATYFFVISPSFGAQREASVAQFAKEFPALVPKYFDIAVVKENPFLSRYSHLGGSYKELLLSPFQKTSLFFEEVLDWQYLRRLFAPLGFLVLLSPTVLLVGLCEYLINTLAQGKTMTGLFPGTLHHISLLIPIVFYAAVVSLKKLSRLKKIGRVSPPNFGAFLVFVSALFMAFRSENPVLANPISIASRYVQPFVADFIESHSDLWAGFLPGWGKGLPPEASELVVEGKIPVEKVGLGKKFEEELVTSSRKPSVYIQNPKHGGGDRAVYELLRGKGGAISGPSSLGAKLVVREDYNLFPIRWQEADYIAADLTGAPKSYGSVSVVLGGKTLIGVADFLRKSLNEINYAGSHGVIYSGNGLVLFEQGIGRRLFDVLPDVDVEEETIDSGRGLVFYNFVFPTEIERGKELSFELSWSFEEGYSVQEILEVVPILALTPKDSQVASFYDPVYGLFLFLEDFKPHYIREVVRIPEGLNPGDYEIYLGWHEPLETGMIGHSKLKDVVKLGVVKIE